MLLQKEEEKQGVKYCGLLHEKTPRKEKEEWSLVNFGEWPFLKNICEWFSLMFYNDFKLSLLSFEDWMRVSNMKSLYVYNMFCNV